MKAGRREAPPDNGRPDNSAPQVQSPETGNPAHEAQGTEHDAAGTTHKGQEHARNTGATPSTLAPR